MICVLKDRIKLLLRQRNVKTKFFFFLQIIEKYENGNSSYCDDDPIICDNTTHLPYGLR